MGSIRGHLNIHHLNPKLAIKIFESIISPILIISIFKRLFNYITHLNSLPESTIAKQAFLLSKDLYQQNKTSFYGNTTNILKSYIDQSLITDLESITPQSLDLITQNIQQSSNTRFWKGQIEHSPKLCFYYSFKTNFQLENYLTMVKNIDQRKTLTRFRVSNHNLMIEHGRYQNIPRDERLCTVCDKNEIENEDHNTRQNFLTPLNNTSPNHNLTVDLNHSNICKICSFMLRNQK